MRIGIRGHDVKKGTPRDLALGIKKAGFTSTQLVLPKAIWRESFFPLIKMDLDIYDLKRVFDEIGVQVAMLGAYFNPVHSNKEKVAEGVENFKDHLKRAKLFGTELVGTETGSYHDDVWTWHERHASEEAFQEVLRIFKDLLPVAEAAGTYLTIEPAYHHVISTPERLKRLVLALDSPNVRVIFDLFNLLHQGNTHEQRQLIDEMVECFNDQIAVVHAKDFVLKEGKLVQVAPGKGEMDYPYLIAKLRTLQTSPDLILEGVTGEDIPFSRDYLIKLLNESRS